MSNLETRTGKADTSSSNELSVAERKEAARLLRPVRNDPQAATKPSDFVAQQVREIDGKTGLDVIPDAPKQSQSTPPAPNEGPEGLATRKNAEADAKRAAAAESTMRSKIVELEEQLAGTVKNAETKIDELNTIIAEQVETIMGLEHKLSTIEGIADEDDDESDKDDEPSAADIAKQKKADATAAAKAKASAKKK